MLTRTDPSSSGISRRGRTVRTRQRQNLAHHDYHLRRIFYTHRLSPNNSSHTLSTVGRCVGLWCQHLSISSQTWSVSPTSSAFCGRSGRIPFETSGATPVSGCSANGSWPEKTSTVNIPNPKTSAGLDSVTMTAEGCGSMISGASHLAFPVVGESTVRLALALRGASP